MLDTLENNSADHGLISPRDNNLPTFAVRGIGPAGLDLVAITIAALHAADALSSVMRDSGARGLQVRAWVVTAL